MLWYKAPPRTPASFFFLSPFDLHLNYNTFTHSTMPTRVIRFGKRFSEILKRFETIPAYSLNLPGSLPYLGGESSTSESNAVRRLCLDGVHAFLGIVDENGVVRHSTEL